MTSVETHLVTSISGPAAPHQRDLYRVQQTEFGAGGREMISSTHHLQPHVRLNISISVFATI